MCQLWAMWLSQKHFVVAFFFVVVILLLSFCCLNAFLLYGLFSHLIVCNQTHYFSCFPLSNKPPPQYSWDFYFAFQHHM